MPGDLRAGVETLADVDQLDLVGIDHIEFRMGVRGTVDSRRGDLRLPELGSDLLANLLVNRHCALTFPM